MDLVKQATIYSDEENWGLGTTSLFVVITLFLVHT